MPKLFNIFNKNKNTQKTPINNNLTKSVSYYNTDREEYVNTRIPIHMNIIHNKNVIKPPSNLENIAGPFLYHNNNLSENTNIATFNNNDSDNISVNLLRNIIDMPVYDSSSIKSNNTSYDSFFDKSYNSEINSDDSEYNYSENSNNENTSIFSGYSDNSEIKSESDINTFLDFYESNTDHVPTLFNKVISDNDSIKSNIFSSRYRNKINQNEPSELLYIPSEN